MSPAKLPAIAKKLPIGNPGDLLQRQPDILSSERKLAAATAEIGVATADLFPQVSLSGFLGFLGFTAGCGSQIGSSAAQAWGFGPSITWAAFDLGSVRAKIRGAKAEAEGALAGYEQKVLLALEESETPSVITANAKSAWCRSFVRVSRVGQQQVWPVSNTKKVSLTT
ncbi:hypothetical protein PproGo58_30300 [Pseudomonas protegens]|nr:hypothetical protein PproGo58_30300 [Pseudomonas protegens]